MSEYPKIDTLYERGEGFKVDMAKLKRPEFALIKHWLVTEKIDGTNIRVSLEIMGGAWTTVIRGRTDNSQLHTGLLQVVHEMFPPEKMQSLWRPDSEGNERQYPITLYGEGYGEKIQSGGHYRKGQSFRLFDVLIGETWLGWANVWDVAQQLGIDAAPVEFDLTTIEDVTTACREGRISSTTARYEGTPRAAEGVVAKTDPPLFNAQGKRVMWKLKTKDF